MANQDQRKKSVATDYLGQISLDIKQKDLKNNPPLVKKFLQELKEVKADNLALRDSLESTQNAFEGLNASYHELDKENAVLKAEKRTRLGISIIQDLMAAGVGAGIGALIADQIVIGLAVSVPCAIVYIICRFSSKK
ncbi:MAG TPA: hypothetical protein VLF87_02555 [Patescibacteria group bacterium]|nr:hypothetical protein [Patescibacteria group bacterium]